MEKEEKKEKKFSKKALLKSWGIFRYLKKDRWLFLVGLLLLVVSGLLVIVITALLGRLVNPSGDNSLPGGQMTEMIQNIVPINPSWGDTGLTLTVLVVILIIQGIFSFLRVYIFAYVTENAMFDLRRDAFNTIIRMPMQFFNERRVGDLSSRLSADISTIQETLTITLAEFIRQTVIIIVGIGWLVSYSYKLTLVMLLTLPVMIIAIALFGRFIKKLGKETQDKVAESGVIVNESLTGIVNVKSFSNEIFESLRFAASIKSIRKVALKGAIWRGVFGTFIIIFLFGALGLVMGVGAYLRDTGELPGGVLSQFIFITGLVAGSIGGLAAQMGSINRSLGVIENVMEILDQKTEDISLEKLPDTKLILGNITFQNVNFRYPSRQDVEVLGGVNFEVKSGQTVALVGSSGSGKSTIAALIQRFYDPTSGNILFDGKNATDYTLQELRSQMAYVPQEVILFGGTIKENIAYGKPEATIDEIKNAAAKANALGFIESFPDGFETVVGERGIQLSGGQRQRIAIARAVLRNPTVLLLDEATSALDSESEQLVQSALDNLMLGRTSLVIAHRLSTIRNADLIVVLEKGKVVESGTHQELISKDNGIYKRLSEIQYHIDSENP
ncbi:MAG: ABC transporter ATP-binding protein [Flavobacteriales bacterium]